MPPFLFFHSPVHFRSERSGTCANYVTYVTMDSTERIDLLNTLNERFSNDELEELCFSMLADPGVGNSKRTVARRLIEHVERRGLVAEFVALCRRLRPDVELPLSQNAPNILPPLAQVMKETVTRETQERLLALRRVCSDQLRALSYDNGTIANFDSCFAELAANGLDHGCETNTDAIELTIDITHVYAALTVANLTGKQFDVDQLVEQQRTKLAAAPLARRGRGLLVVYELSDLLLSVSNSTAAKVVLYHEPVRIHAIALDGLAIIELSSGLDNPSVNRRLEAKVRQCTSPKLIIHIAKRSGIDQQKPGTRAMAAYVDMFLEFWANRRNLAIFLGTLDEGELFISAPPEFSAHSWQQALTMVGCDNLLSQVEQLCSNGVLKLR